MANVLMAWELGAGLGHIANLRPIVVELTRRGHRLMAALRQPARAPLLSAGLPIECFQAPFDARRTTTTTAPPAFVNLLENIGFDNPAGLSGRIDRWREIFAAAKPDLLLCEHSPTALLAARGRPFRTAAIGTGFTCPPCGETLPILRPWLGVASEQVRAHETRVTGDLNRLLASRSMPPLKRLPDLYRDVDATFITSFAELDHFERTEPTRYHGVWSLGEGESFTWPAGDGPRVFAYLKSSPIAPAALRRLAIWRFPTIVVSHGGRLIHEHMSATLQFAERPLDMRQVAAECGLGIFNANHATTATLLRAGRPLLLLPISLEQILLAIRLKRQALAAAVGPQDDEPSVESWLRIASENPLIRATAANFSGKHAAYDEAAAIEGIADRLEALASRPA